MPRDWGGGRQMEGARDATVEAGGAGRTDMGRTGANGTLQLQQAECRVSKTLDRNGEERFAFAASKRYTS